MAAKKNTGRGAPWWFSVLVGTGLVVFPDPLTTTAGLAILTGALAYDRQRKVK